MKAAPGSWQHALDTLPTLAERIAMARYLRSRYPLHFKPATQSRNKREGKYDGKRAFEWQYVTGWGMCGYQGKARHQRTRYRPLSGLLATHIIYDEAHSFYDAKQS